MDEKQDNKKAHRKRHAGPKAEKKKAKSDHKQDLDPRQRNPRAFSIQHVKKTQKIVQRTQDLKTKKQHIPIVDRTPQEPPPVIVAVVGPPKVGKTTLLRCVVKNFTKQRLTRIQGPVTVVSGKQRRLTLIECNNDISSMIDIAKIADLVLLLVDASFGFEMETFEFLNICQVHGFPRIMGVLTHLDTFKDSKRLRKAKKRLKHRFWTEVYQGAKLFYLSGMVNGEYQKMEVHNLCRFISVMKFRPLVWRTTHPYILADRMEDITDPEKVRKQSKCDRNVSIFGYVHGTHMKNNINVHIPGCGDFTIHDMNFLSDPCPTPDREKRRTLNDRERTIYAPMSGVGGIVYDKDAVYIDLGGSHSHHEQIKQDEAEAEPINELVSNLMSISSPMDEKITHSEVALYSQGIKQTVQESIDKESEDVPAENGRVRRRAVFKDETYEDDDDDSDNDSDYDVSSEEEDKNIQIGKFKQNKKKSPKTDKGMDGIEFADTDDEITSTATDRRIKTLVKTKTSTGNKIGKISDDEDDDYDDDDDDEEEEEEEEEEGYDSDGVDEDSDISSVYNSDEEEEHEENNMNVKRTFAGKKELGKSPSAKVADDIDTDEEVTFNLKEKVTDDHKTVISTKLKKSKSKLSDKTMSGELNRDMPSKQKKLDEVVKGQQVESDSDSSASENDSESDSEQDVGVTVEENVTKDDKTDNNSALRQKLMQLSQESWTEESRRIEFQRQDEDEGVDELEKAIRGDHSRKTVEEADMEVELDGSLHWKHDLASQAAANFRQRQADRVNYRKLIYGKDEGDADDGSKEQVEDEIGGLFRVLKQKSEARSLDRLAINSTDCTKCHMHTASLDTVEQLRAMIVDCFVTGKWEESKDAESQLQKDDEMYGDFEDLETGETHAAGERGGMKGEEEEDTDQDSEGEDHDGEVNNDAEGEPKKKTKKEMTSEERRADKKRKLKEMFDSTYDMKGDTEFYDNWKEENEKQAQMNRSVFEDMEDEQRVQYEGFRAGMYVRVEIHNVPCEFVTNFDPTFPVILGGLLSVENNVGYVQTRFKKHRWHKRILKTQNPLIFSLGWRRFQSMPLYSIQDHNMRNRLLKYTPEHMHCHASFWGPITPQGTGLLAVENVAQVTADFRIAGTGVVQELDKSMQIVKKLKLTGTPLKIYNKTAFIQGMFNSSLEVAKFEGASVRTVSGIRGQIKKASKTPEGSYRATFEDKILLSDIVFLRSWYPVEVPQFYNPVTSLLLPGDQKQAWTGMKTVGQLRRERGAKAEFSQDSVYKAIERKTRIYTPLVIPKQLQKLLPFKDTPRVAMEKKETVQRVAVIREPHEAKISKMVRKLKSIHEHKCRMEHRQMRDRVADHQKQRAKVDAVRTKKQKELKKNVFRMLGKMNKRNSRNMKD
ncbi:ribosome biogenesis protein BMS1 homolog isoform X1 [Dreissena polymorpha]|nr:ribosome biogenesis protein BMS1 homolog isoform X1 [Dreissena polymorpha]